MPCLRQASVEVVVEDLGVKTSAIGNVLADLPASAIIATNTSSLSVTALGKALGQERRTVKQIKGALSYPIFMIISGIGITVFLMAFVLPRFAKIYEQREATLPRPTKFLMSISEFTTTQYMWYGPTLVVLLIAIVIWIGCRRVSELIRTSLVQEPC